MTVVTHYVPSNNPHHITFMACWAVKVAKPEDRIIVANQQLADFVNRELVEAGKAGVIVQVEDFGRDEI